MTVTKTPPKKPVDWVGIEVHFRAGIRPLRSIADEFGISHVSITKHAKKSGWTRDLHARIEAKAEEKVTKAAVTKEANKAKTLVTEQQVVEANAELQFRIRMEHRRDVGRARSLLNKLMDEVENETDNLDLFVQLGELLDKTDVNDSGKLVVDKLNLIYQRVISTPGRVESFKKLTDALAITVKLEREAFGIDGVKDEKTSMETVLDRVKAKLAAQKAS